VVTVIARRTDGQYVASLVEDCIITKKTCAGHVFMLDVIEGD